MNFQDFTWINVLPLFVLKCLDLAIIYWGGSGVLRIVGLMTFVIFKCIFEHRESDKWNEIVANCGKAVCDCDSALSLHKSNHSEKNILYFLKLVEQIERKKGYNRILCRINEILWHLPIHLNMALVILRQFHISLNCVSGIHFCDYLFSINNL